MKKKKRVNDNLKTVVVTMSILFFITLMGFYLFNLYINIDINNNDSQTQYSATKTSQTVAQANEESKQIADVVEEVSNSVVGISKLQDNGNSIFLTDGSIKLGLGTGIIVSEDGYIVTNEHVSGSKYSSCYVTLENGKEYQANVVWSDTDLDLSIIKINVKGLEYANLGDSDKIRPGEKVYAIGNPIGFEFQRTVTSGIISAVDRTIKIEEEDKTSYMEDLIQTDATINPGNSGGPLVNADGQVIGINGVKITSAEGISFAIPINSVKSVIESFNTNGKFDEATLGVFAFDKNVLSYIDENLQFSEGIYVASVNTNSAASEAGVRMGDILLSIDGKKLERMCDLRCYIYTKKPGDIVTLKIQRNNREMEIVATLKRK